ncbi:MAG: cell surface protein, partial [Deltaproteobacteria bacterium]
VVSFDPGDGAGFGADRMPDVVLGPPLGFGDARGSTDVVSLGRGGRICVAFDDVSIVDGVGADFVVFENPFYAAGTSTLWIELGEVSVSDDGVVYRTFPCATQGPSYAGCAGWNPVYSRPGGIAADDLLHAGGDAFDLSDVGLTRARYVCVRDLATQGLAPPTTGFDLDAVVAVHRDPP